MNLQHPQLLQPRHHSQYVSPADGRKETAKEDVDKNVSDCNIVVWQFLVLLDKPLPLVQCIVKWYTLSLPDVWLSTNLHSYLFLVISLGHRRKTTLADVKVRSSKHLPLSLVIVIDLRHPTTLHDVWIRSSIQFFLSMVLPPGYRFMKILPDVYHHSRNHLRF